MTDDIETDDGPLVTVSGRYLKTNGSYGKTYQWYVPPKVVRAFSAHGAAPAEGDYALVERVTRRKHAKTKFVTLATVDGIEVSDDTTYADHIATIQCHENAHPRRKVLGFTRSLLDIGPAAIPDLPLSALCLPGRVHNALDMNGIATAAQLSQLAAGDLLAMKGIGERTVAETVSRLETFGIHLADGKDR